MNIWEDKRGFVDFEIIQSIGFIILFGLAFVATILGYIWSKKMGWDALPFWQLIVIIAVEFVGSYFFVARG